MKLIIVTLALVAVALAAPTEEPTRIVSQFNEMNPDGSFRSGFETSDGTKSYREGTLREVKNEKGEIVQVLEIRGEEIYLDNEKNPQVIKYVADVEGYKPDGPSIPKVPTA